MAAVVGCGDDQPSGGATLRLDPPASTVPIGSVVALRAQTGASGAPVAERLTWSVSPDSVGAIDSAGVLRVFRPGTATVTARRVTDGATATAAISAFAPGCEPPAVIEPSGATMGVGGSVRFAARFVPCAGGVSAYTTVWTSQDTAVATVDTSGRVVGRRGGTTTIVAVARENPALRAAVTVNVICATSQIASVTATPTTMTLARGDSARIVAVLQFNACTGSAPPAGTGTGVTFVSSDTAVARVRAVDERTAVVAAVGAGQAVVTVAARAVPTVTTPVLVTVRQP